jgi:hypothetical protein
MLNARRIAQAKKLAREDAHADFFQVDPWREICTERENLCAAGTSWVENTHMSVGEKVAFGELFAQTYEAAIARLTCERHLFGSREEVPGPVKEAIAMYDPLPAGDWAKRLERLMSWADELRAAESLTLGSKMKYLGVRREIHKLQLFLDGLGSLLNDDKFGPLREEATLFMRKMASDRQVVGGAVAPI